MGTKPEVVKGWLGIFFLIYPVIRLIVNAAGGDLPDIGAPEGLMDGVAAGSTMLGAGLLAKSKPIV